MTRHPLLVTSCPYTTLFRSFDDSRLQVIYEDGIQFVKAVKEPYDILIIDGSDPVGPAEGLFSQEFYKACKSALTKDGILTTQTETPWVESYHPDRKSTRLNSSHVAISYAVFCLKQKKPMLTP